MFTIFIALILTCILGILFIIDSINKSKEDKIKDIEFKRNNEFLLDKIDVLEKKYLVICKDIETIQKNHEELLDYVLNTENEKTVEAEKNDVFEQLRLEREKKAAETKRIAEQKRIDDEKRELEKRRFELYLKEQQYAEEQAKEAQAEEKRAEEKRTEEKARKDREEQLAKQVEEFQRAEEIRIAEEKHRIEEQKREVEERLLKEEQKREVEERLLKEEQDKEETFLKSIHATPLYCKHYKEAVKTLRLKDCHIVPILDKSKLYFKNVKHSEELDVDVSKPIFNIAECAHVFDEDHYLRTIFILDTIGIGDIIVDSVSIQSNGRYTALTTTGIQLVSSTSVFTDIITFFAISYEGYKSKFITCQYNWLENIVRRNNIMFRDNYDSYVADYHYYNKKKKKGRK